MQEGHAAVYHMADRKGAPDLPSVREAFRLRRRVQFGVDLRNQIDEVVRTVDNDDYQMLLLYRYIENRTWEDIGSQLGAGKTTVKRWHQEALGMVRMPENPIVIRDVW